MHFDEDPSVISYLSEFCETSYGIVGEVTTIVNGINWTLSFSDRDGVKYYGRVYRVKGRSGADVAAEHSVLNATVETPSFHAVRPLQSRDGRSVLEVDLHGVKRLFSLYPCAPGKPMEYTVHDFRVAGRALAELHRQDHLTALSPHRLLYDPGTLAAAMGRIAEHSAETQEVSAELSACLDELRGVGADAVPLKRGFCHGDFRVSNVHIEGDCAHIFDWDDCGVGPYWGDLAKMAAWLDLLDLPDAADIWNALASSYGLSSDDRRARLAIRWLVATGSVINAASVLESGFDTPAESLQVLFARAIEAAKRARDDALRIG
ncbi:MULTISPECIES: phosphotransferase enzyme family protein [unclassified Bradyrhizobium]|uniref:phosphotransferase enzyme family protein n=1 Tax=unclassified Bradyrhizobium TaxID=2631580 RepID=UPI002916E737|nr:MULTISPECIES: phosphotransferase [unclassified Bradyrhizobium]